MSGADQPAGPDPTNNKVPLPHHAAESAGEQGSASVAVVEGGDGSYFSSLASMGAVTSNLPSYSHLSGKLSKRPPPTYDSVVSFARSLEGSPRDLPAHALGLLTLGIAKPPVRAGNASAFTVRAVQAV